MYTAIQESGGPASGGCLSPTTEEVAATLAKLRTAFEGGAFDERVAALTEAETCLHDDVVAFVAGAIKDDAREVRVAAAESLGRMHVTSARQALHGFTKRKALMEDAALAVEIYKSIGRHADTASIDVLEDNALGSPDTVADARILALGKIRDEDSVEALMGLMNRVRVAKGGGDGKHMLELRIALHVLTGVDQGNDRRDWQRWWNDSKHKLEVSAEVPELDQKLGRVWRNFWGEEEGTQRKKKDDPAPEPGPQPEPPPTPAPEPEPTPPADLRGRAMTPPGHGQLLGVRMPASTRHSDQQPLSPMPRGTDTDAPSREFARDLDLT